MTTRRLATDSGRFQNGHEAVGYDKFQSPIWVEKEYKLLHKRPLFIESQKIATILYFFAAIEWEI